MKINYNEFIQAAYAQSENTESTTSTPPEDTSGKASPNDTFTVMGKGLLAIFIVMGILYVAIKLLNKFTSGKKKKAGEDKQ